MKKRREAGRTGDHESSAAGGEGQRQVMMIVRKKQQPWGFPTWTGSDVITELPAEQLGDADLLDGAPAIPFWATDSGFEDTDGPPSKPKLWYTPGSQGGSRPLSRLQDTQSEGLGWSPIPSARKPELPVQAPSQQPEVKVVDETTVPVLPSRALLVEDKSVFSKPADEVENGQPSELKPNGRPTSADGHIAKPTHQHQPKRKLDWKKNRGIVARKKKNTRICIAVLGVSGMVFAILQNEIVFRGNDPRSRLVDICKAANSVLSLLSTAFLFRSYYLDVLFKDLREYLYSFSPRPHHFYPWQIRRFWKFWLEFALCSFHIPPFITFTVSTRTMQNFILYRAETLGSCANVLRIYLLWPCFRDQVLSQFPKHHTVAAFYNMKMESAFALKTVINGNYAVQFIACVWVVTMLMLAYWFRAVENTACQFWNQTIDEGCYDQSARLWMLNSGKYFEKVNDLYVQNAAWAMFVTSTTVGFGDIVPTTHFGRAISAVMAILGIAMIALLTASLANSLQYTPAELSAILVMEREKARQRLSQQAAERIKYWWRVRQGKQHQNADTWSWKIKFEKNKRASQVDVEDCMADNVKVDKVSEGFKYIAAAMDLIQQKVAEQCANEEMNMPRVRSDISQKSVDHPVLGCVIARRNSVQLREEIQLTKAASDSEKNKTKTDVSIPASHPLHEKQKARMARKRPKAWKQDKEVVQRAIVRAGQYAALFGLMGTASALTQNELVVRGGDPRAFEINVLKGLASVLTVLCMAWIVRLYWLDLIFVRIIKHISRGSPLDTNVKLSSVFSHVEFWIEMVVVAIHAPPFFTFEMGTTSLQNFSLYRAETLACTWNLARIYLLWRVIREWAVSDLPKRHTVAAFASVRIGSIFAIKRLLNSWYALFYLASAWFVLVMMLGYLFRSAELTACQSEASLHESCVSDSANVWTINGQKFQKRNDLYIQNAVWLTFIASMTVGYGDVVPTTHYGRVATSLASVLGIVMASLVTASFSNMIQWHPSEHAARAIMIREQARQQLATHAVNMVSYWWRKTTGKRLSKRQSKISYQRDVRREFHEVKMTAVVDVEDCASSSSKLEQIVRRVREMQSRVDSIADKLLAEEATHASQAYAELRRSKISAMRDGDREEARGKRQLRRESENDRIFE